VVSEIVSTGLWNDLSQHARSRIVRELKVLGSLKIAFTRRLVDVLLRDSRDSPRSHAVATTTSVSSTAAVRSGRGASIERC